MSRLVCIGIDTNHLFKGRSRTRIGCDAEALLRRERGTKADGTFFHGVGRKNKFPLVVSMLPKTSVMVLSIRNGVLVRDGDGHVCVFACDGV